MTSASGQVLARAYTLLLDRQQPCVLRALAVASDMDPGVWEQIRRCTDWDGLRLGEAWLIEYAIDVAVMAGLGVDPDSVQPAELVALFDAWQDETAELDVLDVVAGTASAALAVSS